MEASWGSNEELSARGDLPHRAQTPQAPPPKAQPTAPPTAAPTGDVSKAPAYSPRETLRQEGALFERGADLRLFVVGSSNVVWMTWVPQLHLELSRLGYRLPKLNSTVASDDVRYPLCDDSRWFARLDTSHLGKVGYSSWDFAYNDWAGCQSREGGVKFRYVNGVTLRCGQGSSCDNIDKPLEVRLSDVAADASGADVVVLSEWFNDHKGPTTEPPFKCFNGEHIEKEDTARVAIPHVLKLVKAIHEANNETWVLVMREYPMTQNLQVWEETVPWIDELNSQMKEAVDREPRTLFVDYPMPSGVEMYQKANYGHPNCRGSRMMAQGVAQALFKAKVTASALKLKGWNKDSLSRRADCAHIDSAPECQASALCWVDLADNECKAYGAGSDKWHSLEETRAMF